jgi:peptidoglycan/xylan/chitin deacetylase (PgdA/CDA1 family)
VEGTSEHGSLARDEIAARRRRRREAERKRRRVYRRRRLTALAATGAIVAVPVLLIGGGSRDSPVPTADSSAVAATEAPSLPSPKLVRGLDGPAPVLMYHVIAEAPADAVNPGLFVPPEELKEQVRWLARRGFGAVTLSQLERGWDGGEIPAKPVVLTFDDGTRDQHDAAAPILAELGWPGVLDLKVESLEQGEMTDGMIDSMLSEGWELASHTASHTDLTLLDAAGLQREVAGSRRELASRFGVPVDFFCYPSGAYDAEVIAAVEDAGYAGATTTNPGLAEPDAPFELSRIRVEPGDGAAGLEAKLEAAGVET